MPATLRYLSSADVARLMPPMGEVVDLVEATLRHAGEGHTQLPPKTDIAPGGDAFLHAMPAYVQPLGALGIKWVAGFPGNKERGLPYIHGTIVMSDPESGRTIGVVDAAAITAARTGACAAVTARHLADPNSEVFSIVGCGAVGRASIEALRAVFPRAERMLAYDVDVARQAAFADEVMTTFDLASIIPADPREACEGGHVIVTSTPIRKQPQPFIEPAWIQTGTLCVALDFDSAFSKASFERADLYVTDDLEQYRAFHRSGYFAGLPEPSGDLGAICAGRGPKRPDGAPIVMSANLGLGILDVALAAELLKRAEKAGAGTVLPA